MSLSYEDFFTVLKKKFSYPEFIVYSVFVQICICAPQAPDGFLMMVGIYSFFMHSTSSPIYYQKIDS